MVRYFGENDAGIVAPSIASDSVATSEELLSHRTEFTFRLRSHRSCSECSSSSRVVLSGKVGTRFGCSESFGAWRKGERGR